MRADPGRTMTQVRHAKLVGVRENFLKNRRPGTWSTWFTSPDPTSLPGRARAAKAAMVRARPHTM
eukprot:449036-Prymnesium_polylepis.1